jgi:hypothetical protein
MAVFILCLRNCGFLKANRAAKHVAKETRAPNVYSGMMKRFDMHQPVTAKLRL